MHFVTAHVLMKTSSFFLFFFPAVGPLGNLVVFTGWTGVNLSGSRQQAPAVRWEEEKEKYVYCRVKMSDGRINVNVEPQQ